MSIPDFERAQYNQPPASAPVEQQEFEQPAGAPASALPLAILFGAGGAVAGAVGYGLISMSGFMVSIVTIAIGWMVARAMMTATGGYGSRTYQVTAVVLTYFGTTGGMLLGDIFRGYRNMPVMEAAIILVAGPVLRLMNNIGWGAIGLLILFYGLRTAWQLAAGTPGFGQPGGRGLGWRGIR
jgi:hypothetical protein